MATKSTTYTLTRGNLTVEVTGPPFHALLQQSNGTANPDDDDVIAIHSTDALRELKEVLEDILGPYETV